MDKEMKCLLGEQAGEIIIGSAMGIVTKKVVLPKCDNTGEKIVVSLGASLVGFVAGRIWAKHWFKFCDANFGTDFEDDGMNEYL